MILTLLGWALCAPLAAGTSGDNVPVFNLGFLGPLAFQTGRFFENAIAAQTAKLDFESADAPLPCDGCNSRFGIRLLVVDDSRGGPPSKDLAREGALNLMLGNVVSRFDFDPIVGLLGGQIPSNCGASVEIGHVMNVPQVAWGCAMDIGTPGQYPYFARTHQMDFPNAFAAISRDFGWKRFTVVWETDESFSASNTLAIMEAARREVPGVAIVESRLESKQTGGSDYEQWQQSLLSGMEARNRIWFAALGPDTSKEFFPRLLEWDILQPWMQWVVSGSCKSSIIGQLNRGAVAAGFLGFLVVRPYSYHKSDDQWMASTIFKRVSDYGADAYQHSGSFYGLEMPDGRNFSVMTYGEGIKSLAPSFTLGSNGDLGGGWASNHNWPFVYDAVYSFIYAINALLKAGVAPTEIKGKTLLDAVASVNFTGVSKQVSFQAGKRSGDWAIDNFQPKSSGEAWTGWKAPMVGSLQSGSLVWKSGAVVRFRGGSEWTAGAVDMSPVPGDRHPRCDDGSVRAINGSCVLCPPGFYASDAGGRWSNGSDPERERCVPCAPATFAAQPGAASCSLCDSGTSSGVGAQTCDKCPAGKFSQAGYPCSACQAGTFTDAPGASKCALAPAGSFVATAGATEATPCSLGRVSLFLGAEACSSCSPGRYAQNGVACVDCAVGSFSSVENSSTCEPCGGESVTTAAAGTRDGSGCICSAGYYEVQALAEGGYVCTACPSMKSSPPGATSEQDCALTSTGATIVTVAVLAPVLLLLSGLVAYFFHRRLRLKYERQSEEILQERLTSGIEAVSKLAHPLVLVPAKRFLGLGWEELKNLHEHVRNSGCTVYLDTLDAVQEFKRQGNKVVFFSYQWLSWDSAGPNPTQWECMKEGVENARGCVGAELGQVYIWLDILSIPQCNDTLKGLAVQSLYTYAQQADTLVVIAPKSRHDNLNFEASLETYQKRVWCRAEQMAFFCARGCEKLFLKTALGSFDKVSDSYMEDITCIFDGEMTCCTRQHEGGARCDKESLVAPLMGMYFDLCKQHLSSFESPCAEAAWDFVAARESLIFPREFGYIRPSGEVVNKELFGNLIEKLKERISKDVQAANAFRELVLWNSEPSCYGAAHSTKSYRLSTLCALDAKEAADGLNRVIKI